MNLFEGDERLFAIAMEIAKDAHKGQTRKNSNEPYINHPIRVAEGFKDVTEFYLTALLHDVVEDSHLAAQRYSYAGLELLHGSGYFTLQLPSRSLWQSSSSD